MKEGGVGRRGTILSLKWNKMGEMEVEGQGRKEEKREREVVGGGKGEDRRMEEGRREGKGREGVRGKGERRKEKQERKEGGNRKKGEERREKEQSGGKAKEMKIGKEKVEDQRLYVLQSPGDIYLSIFLHHSKQFGLICIFINGCRNCRHAFSN